MSEILVQRAEFVRASDKGAVAVWVRSEDLPLISREDGRKFHRLFRRELGLKAANRLLKLHMSMVNHHPRSTHDYLFLLAVRPHFQRAGIGAQLMAQHLVRSDRMGRCCFLETSDSANLTFYAHFGFEVIDRYVINGTSPPTWAMWRRAKAG